MLGMWSCLLDLGESSDLKTESEIWKKELQNQDWQWPAQT